MKGYKKGVLRKHFTMRVYMQNMWEKGDVEIKKFNFFYWLFGNNRKIAIPAEFESSIPSATCNSESCYFFLEIFCYLSYYIHRRMELIWKFSRQTLAGKTLLQTIT